MVAFVTSKRPPTKAAKPEGSDWRWGANGRVSTTPLHHNVAGSSSMEGVDAFDSGHTLPSDPMNPTFSNNL